MKKIINLYHSNPDSFVKLWFIAIASSMIFIAFLIDSPSTIANGLITIIQSPDRLITDYVEIAGFGAAFVNAALLIYISLILIQATKASMNGLAIAAIFLMGGFGLFGKNISNIWGILLGVYLYSRFDNSSFSKYIYVGFFGTSLAPISTELILWNSNQFVSLVFAFLLTVSIGFLLPPISAKTISVHQGYNLYNVGFAAGLLALVVASIMTSFGYTSQPVLIWHSHHNISIILYLYILFISFIWLGIRLDINCLREFKSITKHSGRLVSDYYLSNGFAAVLFNMGILGSIYTTYILAVGGHLNGPTIGGLLTIVGFAGFGKHLRNTIPLTLGVLIGSSVKIWNIDDPSVLLGALFATGLAPIAGQYGFFAGILAGFIHLSIVINIGGIYQGMNLYNNGFAAGLVALFLIPIFDAFQVRRKKR